jgi:hypothetical protein
VKARVAEVPPPGAGVTTLTGTDPAAARSAAVIAARNRLALTNVVVREAPPQRTTDEVAKPLPLTVRVRLALPAVIVAGDRVRATGTGGAFANVAVTFVVAFRITTQAALPLHAPLQRTKTEPAAGWAVSVTAVPPVIFALQVGEQAMPAGVLVTVPAPVLVIDSLTEVAAAAAEPLTPRETVSPAAAKVTLAAKLPAVVGRKRTVTARLAPAPSEKDAPEVMLNGAPTLAVTARLAGLVFRTVKVRSAVPLIVTLPKLLLAEGVTSRAGCATPLAALEHALSLPLVSTAVTRTK